MTGVDDTESRSPLAGLQELGRGTLYLLGASSALKALALVGLATSLAAGIVSVIDGTPVWQHAVLWGIAWALLRAGASWAQRVISARAVLGAKEQLRGQLAERLIEGGGFRLGSATTLATQGLDQLDKYYTVFLPALINSACIPLLVGARILFADWVSALIVVLTVPLIPLFMALIGMHTQERVAAATTALGRLSDHLVELAKGLPVLLGLGRAKEQLAALKGISERYRVTTMQTLRTAFLSSLALELIATISVAVVAVFIGVRLVGGGMSLELGLLALLLAPECYTPLRELGSAFHSSQEGRDALSRVRAILRAPLGQSPLAATTDSSEQSGAVVVEDLAVSYPGRSDATISGLSFMAPAGAITVLDGPSGSGKSTILAALSGRRWAVDAAGDNEGDVVVARVTGTITGIDRARVAWLPQHPHATAATVLGELRLYAGDEQAGDAALRGMLAELGLEMIAGADPARISPGELRRLAFARVLARVRAGATVVLLDEPTAHLDDRSAALVIEAIRALPGRATVIVASHDPAVRTLGSHTVALGGAAPSGVLPPSDGSPLTPEPASAASVASSLASSALSSVASAATLAADSALAPRRSALAELTLFLRPVSGTMLGTVLLGTLSTGFAVALTGVSAWLIVRASEQPPIMYLLVAIVGVRFFGLGRAVLRYCERLVGHDAIFGALGSLRMRLWSGLSELGSSRRSLLTGASVLDRLVRDVDQLRDLSLRVVAPVLVGIVTLAAAVTALAIISPATLPLFLGLAIVGLVVAPATAVIADRAAARAEQGLRSGVLRRFAAMLGAADDLRANGVDGRVRRQLRELDAQASAAARRGAWALGLGGAVVVAACCIAALLVLPLTADAVASGSLEGALVAVLVLTPIGLIDPLLDVVAAAQQWPALASVLRRVSSVTDSQIDTDVAEVGAEFAPQGSITSLELEGVSARWPGAEHPVFSGLSARVGRGEWLVVTGPSGSGKSTLLTLMLGYLWPERGRYLLGGRELGPDPAAALRGHIAWCPQEGHLFDSSLRANLLLARPRDDAPDDAEMLETLRRVGLGPLMSRLADGLDAPIGPGGSRLSGGERQRLAVARTLLTRSEVILIDEPTAHLDEPAAIELMADLRRALDDRITVLVTHHAVGVRADDHRLVLGDHARPGDSGSRTLSMDVGAPA